MNELLLVIWICILAAGLTVMISPELWSNGQGFIISALKLSVWVILFIGFISIPYWIYR